MTQAQTHQLFESFTQADNSIIRKYGGSGLGLSISKALANLMGGSIECKSIKGKGSTFSFQIPLTPVKLEDMSEKLSLRPMKTLVVANDSGSVDVLCSTLNFWGLNTDSCYTADNVIQMLETSLSTNSPYELLIIDWIISDIAGIKLVEKINQQQSLSSIKNSLIIIILTDFNQDGETLKRAEQLCDCLVEKPIQPYSLKHEIFQLQTSKFTNKPVSDDKHADETKAYEEKSVLVVEDNLTNQIVATEYLKRFGVNIITSNNGLEAIKALENHKVDLVLMDLHMPVMDGYSATRQIREMQGLEKLPIYAMSAAVMQSDIERVKLADMNGHIAKPIDMEKLGKVIQSTLGTTSSVLLPKPQTHFEDNVLEPEGFDVSSALSLCGNSAAAYEKILAGFIVDYENVKSEITDYLHDQNFTKIRTIAHNLASAAGSIGASDLQQLAKQIDQEFQQSKTIPKGSAEQLAIRLEHALNEIKQVLPQQDIQLETEQYIAPEKKIEVLENLLQVLKDSKFISASSLHQNMPDIAKAFSSEKYSLLLSHINKLEYSLAQKMVEKELIELNNL